MILGKVLNLALPRAGLFLPQDAGPLHPTPEHSHLFHKPADQCARSSCLCHIRFGCPQLRVLLSHPASTFYLSHFKSYLMSHLLCKTWEAWINVSWDINVCFLPRLELIEGRDITLLSPPPGTWATTCAHIVGTQWIKCLSSGLIGHRCQWLNTYFVETACKSFSLSQVLKWF